MKTGLTELVFIIDRSGSMQGLESDTIGGFNAMLKEQQAAEGEAVVTTVLFDNQYELLHDRIDIKAVSPLTSKDYTVGGGTALLDAMGKTIKKIRKAQEATAEEYRAEKVLFVIITDGMENASRDYNAKDVKKRVERQKEEHGWEFIFLGANMDAIAEADKLGISANRAHSYRADRSGIASAYGDISFAATSYRIGKGLDDWFDQTEAEQSDPSGDGQEDVQAAAANLKQAAAELKGAMDGLMDFVQDVQEHGAPLKTVNDIAKEILGDGLI
jgi:uncharacterized protein YegL